MVPTWLRHLDTAPLALVAAVVVLAAVAASVVPGLAGGSAPGGTGWLLPAGLAAAVVALWVIDLQRA